MVLRKPYKTITQENGTVKIYGNGHIKELKYGVPDWNEESEEEEAYFDYKGNKCFLSEYMRIDKNSPDFFKEFDGYASDSFFSGTVIKLTDDCEGVKVYTYIS